MSDPLDIVRGSTGVGADVRRESGNMPKRKASAIFGHRLHFWGATSTDPKRANTGLDESSDDDMLQDEDLADNNTQVVANKPNKRWSLRATRLPSLADAVHGSRSCDNLSGIDPTDDAANVSIFMPPVICECVLYLKAHGLQTQGIFRIPGENSRVKALAEAYARGQKGLLEENPSVSVHDVATLLKTSIRNLPEPLVPFHVYKKFLRAMRKFEDGGFKPSGHSAFGASANGPGHANNLATKRTSFFARHLRSDTGSSITSVGGLSNVTTEGSFASSQTLVDDPQVARRARVICEVALTLPLRQCQCLSMVLNLLYIVSELAAENKMTTQALAVVFAPTLMHTPDNVPPETVLRDMPIAIAATKVLIENAEALPHPDPYLMNRISSAMVA
ncbi:Rho GTPase activating protein, putative [Hondaea fermentalgiana]|uniref:Rho GTPase activating protein, putative n=1 Tax=Hondaea fermentalgiana TaxID=2315210 RepID=A0A2R5GS66_9STRA|nr:Rho GTPase activating protein, putative [Hondaea fermentalgiana]|eukprot:GBG33435.1 Rho GTPase activating protein, putative [Hondaea fermentalgiana]